MSLVNHINVSAEKDSVYSYLKVHRFTDQRSMWVTMAMAASLSDIFC